VVVGEMGAEVEAIDARALQNLDFAMSNLQTLAASSRMVGNQSVTVRGLRLDGKHKFHALCLSD
jgi:hypothetical protein